METELKKSLMEEEAIDPPLAQPPNDAVLDKPAVPPEVKTEGSKSLALVESKFLCVFNSGFSLDLKKKETKKERKKEIICLVDEKDVNGKRFSERGLLGKLG